MRIAQIEKVGREHWTVTDNLQVVSSSLRPLCQLFAAFVLTVFLHKDHKVDDTTAQKYSRSDRYSPRDNKTNEELKI